MLDVTSLGELVRRRAQLTPNRDFLVCGTQRLTFADAHLETDRLARALRNQGVAAGARVAIMLRNGLDFPLVWLALAKIGAVAVPINAGAGSADLRHMLEDATPHVVVAEPDLVRLLAQLGASRVCTPDILRTATGRPLQGDLSGDAIDGAAASGATLLNLQYTSGTTGMPKACMLSHSYWLQLAHLAQGFAAVGEGDVTVTAAPFHYIDPQWNVVLALAAASTLVVLPAFDARTYFRDVAASGATFCYLVGTMSMLLLKQHRQHPVPPHRLRLIVCSGIPAAAHAELEERFGVPWREAYGATETGLDLVMPIGAAGCVGSGAVGVAVAGKEVSVRRGRAEVATGEIGELCVRGDPMMSGYWNRDEPLLDPDGWRRTGDLASRDGNGWFRLLGRDRDMVRRGGENISAVEVETALLEHPSVVAAAIVPVPDEVMGEEAKAYVQLQPGATVAPAALVAFVRERLATFKAPRYVQVVTELPRTPSERIAKGALQTLDHPEATFDARQASLATLP